MSLIGQLVADTSIRGIRLVGVTPESYEGAITCNSHDSWVELLKRALTLGDDGIVALRVMLLDGAVTAIPACANGESLEDGMRTTFVNTTDGVALVAFDTGGTFCEVWYWRRGSIEVNGS